MRTIASRPAGVTTIPSRVKTGSGGGAGLGGAATRVATTTGLFGVARRDGKKSGRSTNAFIAIGAALPGAATPRVVCDSRGATEAGGAAVDKRSPRPNQTSKTAAIAKQPLATNRLVEITLTSNKRYRAAANPAIVISAESSG